MTIYDTSGEVILDAPVTTDAVIRYVLMGDYYIGLPFNLLEPADFPRGSYVMYKGRKFEIMSNVRPEFDDTTGGYKYSLQFWAQQNHMKRRKCKWLQGQNPETTFHDTTDLASFGNLIADNMNAFLGGENWKVAAVPEEFAEVTKLVSFDRDSCWDAINTIAETFDVEWWTVENGAEVWIYFGKLEFGTPEVFKRGDVVTSIPAKKGDDANYGTRFFVFGSTRNLTADYGQAPQGGTTNHVSEVRLRLPNGQEYIDARENLKPADVVEQVAYFEDIYPKNTDTVTSVDRSQDRQTSNGTKYKARIIYAKDAPFVPTDLIEGETLQAVITSGPLSGRTFDIQLGDRFQDPDAWNPEQNPFDRKFEIVADIEDAGDGEELIIPNDSLDIDVGDTFVLTGVKLPDERIKEAEQELLKAGKAWAVKNSSDTDVYDCPTNPVYCQRHDKNYDPGQKVLLQDPRFGASGRQSRIQGFEKKLYNEYIATYTVGDNTSYSRLAAIEKDIEESAYAERIGVVNGVGIYLIRSKYDTTLPTDYNAYSALAAETLFLNKRKGGTVLGSTTFDKDITIGGSVVSKDFRQGDFSGSGFGAYRDGNGNAVLEADILKIRKEAIFNEAVINQVTFRVGATVFSNGGCEITRVEELKTAFRCYYDNKEGRRYSGLTAGDQVRCQRYDPTQHTIIKYYWRLVTAVGEDYVELSKSDADGSASPEEGDEIAQFGNRSDITRQSAIVINPLDGGSVEVYAHIDAYSLSEKNYVGMGVNPQTGEAYMYAYGDMFFGDRDLADPNASWITYQKKEGEERRRLRIKADVTFGADSSGLGNLSEFKAQQQQIDDARKEAEEAKKEVAGIQIGGENLLDDSKSLTTKNWSKIVANVYYEKYQGYQCAVIRNSENGGVRCNQTFEAGMNVVSSVWVFSEQACNIGVGIEGYGNYKYSLSDNEVGKWVRVVLQQRTTDNKFVCYLLNGQTSYVVAFRMAQMEEGNKATAWSPSIADQEEAIDAAQQTADNAAAGVDSLKNFTDEAFADGIVDRAEAAAIGKYTNSVNETRKAADAAYAEIYGNPLLGGTAKSNLQAAKSAFDTAAADLLAAIATAADDGIASPGEQADVDAKYTLFNNAYGTFGTRLEEANKYMLTAVNTASQGALQLSQELQGVVNNINETILPDLQAQIDGSIVSWGGEEVPTLSNYPANQWTSDTERKRHIGDYYDRKTTVDGQAAYERYKFAFENNAYQWVRIADSGGAAAIATAREALGLAGTKARIFFGATTPAVPYSVNDVWFRSSGAGATLETTVYISNADKGQQETAAAADWQLVDDSQVRLRQMSSDGVISREEKASLRNRLAQIQEAYTSYQNDAATYGVSIAGLAAAYSALVNFLTGTVAVNNDTDTTLSAEQRSAYNAAFAAYDAEVSRFSNLVADAISQGKVDDIQFSAVNLVDGSHADWVAAKANTSGYDGAETVIYIDHTLIRGKQITYRVELKGENAQAPQLGFEIKVHFTDNTDQWIARYSSSDIPDRGTFEKTYVFSSQVQDKEIEYARLYPIFRDFSGEPVSGKLYIKHEFVAVGNKIPSTWAPSIADQEKYADETAGEAVNGVETQIDASKLDQNTYYPVTIKLNGIARSKITVRVNLSDTQPGKPVWGTYNENRFSCQAVWYNNGNSWGSNYDKRVVEEYQHRYADGRPIGSVGQMTNSSNEYIYVRGGGVYRFFATNAGTPVLHTEAYTVNEQTVDLKTSVEPLVSLQEQANSTQQEAETTRQAIADMNDDTIFDVSEKQSIRTQWENISGYARTDVVLDSLSATNGSYYRVRDMAKAAGISTAGLLAAVNSLRVKLNDYALYTASNTPGFDRAGLAVLFTAYYAQEIDVLNAVSQKYTDGKVADIETSMKDYDYLKLVFPNNTVDNNGVFLSRLMAVKNGTSASAAVVAGLYGGGVDSLNNAGFKDPTHGILMMFAGATSIQNVAAAKTRIYGDGTLYTSKLVAQAGTIAGFTIGTGYIGSQNLTGSEYFYLSPSVIKNGKKDTYAMIGDIIYKNRKVAATLYNHYGSTGIGLIVDMGDNSHAAIYVPNGTFSGFRPMSRSYDNGTYTLKGDEEETVFFVNTSKGSTTFYLPSNPQPDQRYEIRKLHSGNSIIINAQNNGDIYVTGSNNPSSQISWTGRRCVTIQYSKNLDAWVMWFSYEA
ncbi:hypothetical protein [uncultured Alistipes sp.]|uniref:hypothetical protein n=1 Tax=uncultured Alistipes sp. TaxID=538949 RepID=UPI00266C6102|nr:hypothetical protein [uncultured Alistipes sp.]